MPPARRRPIWAGLPFLHPLGRSTIGLQAASDRVARTIMTSPSLLDLVKIDLEHVARGAGD